MRFIKFISRSFKYSSVDTTVKTKQLIIVLLTMLIAFNDSFSQRRNHDTETEKIDSALVNRIMKSGIQLSYLNKIDSSISTFELAIKLSEDINYAEGKFYTTIELGRTYFYKVGKRPVGVEYYQKALAIAEKAQKPELLSRAYYCLAVAADHVSNLEQAEDYFWRSYHLARKAHHPVHLSAAMTGLVYFYLYRIHRNTSDLNIQPVLDSLTDVSQDPHVLADCWNTKSLIYEEAEDYHKAIEATKISIDNFKKTFDSEPETVDLLYQLSQFYLKIGRTDEVKKRSAEILQFKNVPDLATVASVGKYLLVLSDAYRLENNYKKAWEAERSGHELLDSVQKYEADTEIISIQSEFDLKNKQKEIEILNKDEVIHQTQITRQNQRFIFLIVFTVVLFVFSILLFMIKEARKKANIQINTAFHELKIAQNQFVQSEKMAFLGRLTSGVAHEINTPLGAIKASSENVHHAFENILSRIQEVSGLAPSECFSLISELIQFASVQKNSGSFAEQRTIRKKCVLELRSMGIDKPEALAEYASSLAIDNDLKRWEPLLRLPRAAELFKLIDEVLAIKRQNLNIGIAVNKASKILFALKKYSYQIPDEKPTEIDVIENIETVLSIYSNNLKQTRLVKNFDSVEEILGYPDELNQVWTNLIHNSIQAMDGKGQMTINVKMHSPEEIKIELIDHGHGISAENQKKIFEPFFTTKASGEGTGLGLSIVKKIIDKHNGRIECESELKKGTTFRIFLPTLKKDVESAEKIIESEA